MSHKSATRSTRRRTNVLVRNLALERLEDRRMLASIPYSTIANDLQSAVNSAQNSLTTLLNTYQSGDNASIPFLGSNLGVAAQFAPQLSAALSVLAATDPATPVPDAFAHAFGSLLVNDSDAQGTAADVHLPNGVASDGSFQAYMRLHVGLNPVTTDFKTGLPALPLLLAGSALDFAVSSQVDYELSFNYSATVPGNAPHTTLIGGHPLTGGLPGNGHELVLVSNAHLPTSFSGTATLGFVQGTIGLASNKTSSVSVTATADQFEGTPMRGPLVFNAEAYLQFTGGITSVPAAQAFPTISTTIHLQWDNSAGGGPSISFDSVTVNLGQFVRNVLGPVLNSIESATSKIKPAIDALTQSLPVLSDISRVIGGGDVSLMSITSIAGSYAGLGPLAGLFSNIVTFIQAFDGFDPSLGSIDLGRFNLDGFNVQNSPIAGNPLDLTNKYLTSFDFSNLAGQASNYSSVVDALPVSADVKANLHKLVSSLSGDPNSIDLEFPFFDKPGKSVFNMLMGRDSDLFTLKGNLAVDAAESTGADLFGMGLFFNGAVHLAGQLTFSYDTYGLRELIRDGASNVVNDILDGFYIKTDSKLQIGGSIGISAGLSAGIASAKVNGSVGTPDGQSINIMIDTSKDTDHDEKLRFHELPTNPFDAFSASGEIDAGLTFEIQIGVNTPLGFAGYERNFDIAHTVVFSFNPPAPPPQAILASPTSGPGAPPDSSGLCMLYVGKQAIRRVGVDDTDGGPDGAGEKYVIKHVGDDSSGETIEVEAFEHSQTISGVKAIWANGDIGDLTIDVRPGVKANVFFNGAPDPFDPTDSGQVSQGHAYLTYAGSGTAQLTAGQLASTLWGGAGGNTLVGGPGGDTLILGSGFNSVVDTAGDNLIIDPASRSGISFTSSPNAYNTLKILAATTTTEISATTSDDKLLVQMSDSDGRRGYDQLPYISQLMVDAQSNAIPITIGTINAQEVTVNLPAASGARAITIDTPFTTNGAPVLLVGRASKEIPDPNNTNQTITRYGVFVTDYRLGGTNISVFGLGAADRLTITQHGGTTNIGDLSGTPGTIIFDTPDRSSGYNERSSLTTPVRTLGSTIDASGYGPFGAYGFLVQAAGDPDVVFKGMTSTDSINLNISAAPFGAPNQVNIDASYGLTTALHVNALGTLATNNILLSAVGQNGTVLIDGAGTNTTATIGSGTLAPIYGNVSVANAILTVDNSTSTAPSNFVMTDSSLTGWDTNLSFTPPRLTFSGLFYVATINLAAGDQFDVESTPLGLPEVDIKNLSGARDLASVAGVTPGAPNHLVFDGDFKLYLGGRLTSDGTVTQSISQLANTSVGFNFTSSHYGEYNPTLIRFLSFAGHTYTIGGNGNLVVTDHTIGLTAIIADYRAQDGVLIDLPGGSVNSDLTRTSAGTITFDGMARLLGASASAQNNITVHARTGAVFMEPTSDVDSVLRLFNTLYILGNRPQDSLDVFDSAGNIAVSNHPIPAAYTQFARATGDPNTVQAGQTFDFTIIAQDAGGNPLTNYTNQVQWYAYNQTTGHYFSSNYEPFAAADQGQHVFHGIVLNEAGTYTLGFDDGWNASSFTLVVSAAAANLSGDRNADGRVDAADYVLLRKTAGTPTDYNTWRTHFGETAVSPPPPTELPNAVGAEGSASATVTSADAVLYATDRAPSTPPTLTPASDLARRTAFERSDFDREILLQLELGRGLAVTHALGACPAVEIRPTARRTAFEQLALEDETVSAQFTGVADIPIGHAIDHWSFRASHRS